MVFRKFLLNGNSRQFLLFAVVEIFLVMIGILLAWQVNNWKERNQLRKSEIASLQEISRDIHQNIISIESNIFNDSIRIDNGNKLIQLLSDPNSTYDSSFDQLFGSINFYQPFYFQDIAYESLKLKGIDIIQNDTLKLKISSLFEKIFPEMEDTGNSFMQNVYLQSNPMFIANFETKNSLFKKSPNNFQKLRENQQFFNLITFLKASNQLMYYFHSNRLREAKEIKAYVDKQINLNLAKYLY